ncbi:MAG: FKBP-type peptidyl-prolyl cis-trans isomerase [Gammaproteobacteria bacterium]|nr:FKBP-type peptidyl-prolyl cis-trans isomerase [Gammaproteobacteria bacterium]MCY4228886.1 FKBP-type peptidyl-prolyl cis-trans isomerase [Gammaproteobacteria bacterium]
MQFKKRSTIITVFFTSALVCSVAQSQNQPNLDDDNKKFSYAIGYQIGQSILAQVQSVPDLDMAVFSDAVTASLMNSGSAMTEQEMAGIIVSRQQQMQEEMAKQAQDNAEKSLAFLEENKTREGVVETESGIQYQIIESGDPSGNSPGLQDTVIVHYEGKLIDGTVFDSSRARETPARFSLTGIIPGWSEILQLMRPGDIWNVVLPPEMAYGEAGVENTIGPNQALVFEIELIEVMKSSNS